MAHRNQNYFHKPVPVPTMTRPKKPDAAEKEARLQETIIAVLKRNTFATPLQLSLLFRVQPYTIVLKKTEKRAIKHMNSSKS